MNEFTLYESFSFIDGDLIERSEKQSAVRKTAGVRRWVAAAACLCVAVAVTAVALHGSQPANTGDKANAEAGVYQASLYSGDDETPVIVSRVRAGTDLPVSVDGTAGTALHVAAQDGSAEQSGEMSMETAREYAYMDADSAAPELRDKILTARGIIIYSKTWVADGYTGFIENVETGEREELPAFSELFPGWDIPTVKYAEGSITEDGLGADLLYGISVRIVEFTDGGITAAVLKDGGIFGFSANQLIFIRRPADSSAESTDLNIGDTVFVAYYGRDCRMASGEISASSISNDIP